MLDQRTQHGGWQLEEDSAAAYERYLVAAFMKDAAERLLDLVQLQPTERVLDVACGTGIVARRAAIARARAWSISASATLRSAPRVWTPTKAASVRAASLMRWPTYREKAPGRHPTRWTPSVLF